MPPTASSSRRPTSRKAATTVDDLTAKFASGLTINGQEKEKRKVASQPSAESKRTTSMRAANTASQSLSALVDSGWKYRKDAAKGSKFSEANTCAAAAATHLSVLRQLGPGDTDIERAAMSVVGKLVCLEMYDAAKPALSEIHSSLLRMLGAPSSAHLISLPIPVPPPTTPTLLTLISNYLIHALIITTNASNLTKLADILRSEYTLISWLPLLSDLPTKHVDSLLTRSFSTLTKCVPGNATPCDAFFMRMHAICYLAYTSPGTVGSPDGFWDQPLRAASAYMKALLSALAKSSAQDEAACIIVQAFSQIVDIIQEGPNKPSLMQGKVFLSFCEYWMELVNRLNDVVLLDKIVALIHWSSSKSPTTAPSEGISPSDMFNVPNFCANLTRTTALLEKSATISLTETTALLNTLHRHLRNGQEVDSKMERAIERLRRIALKALESGVDSDFSSQLVVLLTNIVDILATLTLAKCDRNSLTKALDTLFTVSRVQLEVPIPKSYFVSHDTLSKATAILESGRRGLQPSEEANFLRCISGAFHNLGGQLYQAGQHASSIPFLDDGCKLARKALLLYRSATSTIPDDPSDPLNQLAHQLYRRWQLLAVCFARIGERKSAYNSYIQSINTFPYDTTGFALSAAQCPPSSLFASSPAMQELASIVDKVTYQGLCDLILPPEMVSLRACVDDPNIAGALLERQIDSLEPFVQKTSVKTALPVLAKAAADVYAACGMPIRRARVLVRCLGLGYTYGPELFQSLGKPDKIVTTIEQCLQDPTCEAALLGYVGQYRALAHVWKALHAHRCADERQMKIIAECATQACEILRGMLQPPAPPKPTKNMAAPSKKVVPKPRIARKVAPPPKDPVTPKPRQRKALQDVPMNTTLATNDVAEVARALVFDQPVKLLDVLQSLVHILGFLSFLVSKISVLDVMRRIAEQSLGSSDDQYLLITTQLASEYQKLGKLRRATKLFNQVMPVVKQGKNTLNTAVSFFLRFAEASSVSEDFDQSASLYGEAITLGGQFHDDKSLSVFQRAQIRTDRIVHVAMAYNVFGSIQLFRDDVAGSLDALLQSLRLWNRAFDALIRLQPAIQKAVDDDPFLDSPKKVVTPSIMESSQPKQSFERRATMTSSGWRISEGLLSTFFALCHAYALRGSVREAQFFAQQAEDLADALNAPALVARALGRKAELQLRQGLVEDGYQSLAHALKLLQGTVGVEVVDIHCLKGQYEEEADVDETYQLAEGMLKQLEQTFGVFDGFAFGPRRSSTGTEVLVPDLVTKLLRDRIWRLRNDIGEQTQSLLENLMSLPATSETKAAENSLIAKLTLHTVYKRFRADMFLSSLPESTIALPLVTAGNKLPALSNSAQDIVKSLEDTEALFWSNLELTCKRGSVAHVREAAVRLALIRAFQASLGKEDAEGPSLTTNLLDMSSAVTLRREMDDAILHKFQILGLKDDLEFPAIFPQSKPEPIKGLKPTTRTRRIAFDDTIDDEESRSLRDYWLSVQKRYNDHLLDMATLDNSRLSVLPSTWSVVHINVTDDRSTMFITRQYGGDVHDKDLVFCVPLKGRRDGDDDDAHLTFQDVMAEFQDIIRCSNETTKAAIHVKNDDEGARMNWWKERGALDTRLRELLENLEFCWLGAFKTIMSQRPHLSTEEIAQIRASFDKAFQRGLYSQDKKTKQRAIGHRKIASDYQMPNRVTLDDALMECFSTLSMQCRDEELEDLVYFMLDLYQFHGVPVAIAEIDIDQVVVDLRNALEEHTDRMRRRKAVPREDDHIFLVLDKDIQGLPWENIPILRGQSVSRIPNIEFLLDRIEFARWRRGGDEGMVIDRAVVDPKKGYYILNPSGDLGRTEERFKDWSKDMDSVGWQGIRGRAPSELQFLNALQQNDLVVYFGHGGGEQYVRSHKIRHLPKCAAVMLWGCSSGFLREMGDFDRIGTPYNYMVSGCPTLVANLWDVTDRDIDKFSQSIFDKMHMDSSRITQWRPDDRTGMSIIAAVAQSRNVPKLQYLTGAAPVVYGIPFYL